MSVRRDADDIQLPQAILLGLTESPILTPPPPGGGVGFRFKGRQGARLRRAGAAWVAAVLARRRWRCLAGSGKGGATPRGRRRVSSAPARRPSRARARGRNRPRLPARGGVLMGNPVPVRVSGPRTVVRHCPSTRIPLPSHAAAAACLSTSGPPAFSAPAAPRVVLFQDTTGTAPRPARHVAPRPGSRHAGSCPAGAGSLPRLGGLPWPSVVRLRPRATANVAYGALRCVVDRLCCCVAARHSVSTLGAAITRRALRPGHVACATHVCGAPYHRVITRASTILLARPLARLA